MGSSALHIFVGCLLYTLLFTGFTAKAQVNNNTVLLDSNALQKDSTKINAKNFKSSSALDSKVTYQASDSMVIDIDQQKIYLYNNANVLYENLKLDAARVDLDIKNKTVKALGVKDSTGKVIGNPKFQESDNKFDAREMLYNFETKKGRISDVVTQEGDGYIIGQTIKKTPGQEYYISNGRYTTCAHTDHPHFFIQARKLKVIPEDKIVTGPADLYILDIPSPLLVPFGFFPNKKGRKSGFIIPKPGNSNNLGFSLKEGGYYWGINENIDLAVLGDIYTRGSYRLSAGSNYALRYKYTGNLRLDFSKTKFGLKGDLKNYSEQNNYGVHWRHTQDPKAHPSQTFNAEVNAVSSSFNQFNRTNVQDVLQSSFNSTVNYTKRFTNSPFSLSAFASQSQSTQSRVANLTLPGITLTMNQIYPFKNKNRVGESKWYEAIGFNYATNFNNQLNIADTALKYLIRPDTLFKRANSGLQHVASLATNLKVLKFINLTPSISYNENWHFKQIVRTQEFLVNNLNPNDSIAKLLDDTLTRFAQSRSISVNISATTKLYGMYQLRNNLVKNIRHVITPSIGFNYIPVLKKLPVYNAFQNNSTKEIAYNNYLGSFGNVYNQINQGNIRFSLLNNIEGKVRSKADSLTGGVKKVQFLDFLSFDASYNIFADSLRWSNFNIAARNVFLKTFNITTNFSFDPYAYNDSTGVKINTFQFAKDNKLFRLANANLNIQYSLNSKARNSSSVNKTNLDANELKAIATNPYDYVDFNVPWNFSISYNLNYTEKKQLLTANTNNVLFKNSTKNNITQSVQFRGDINITPKWKVALNSGYDFVNKQFTFTNIDIYRDLHCWELRFNLIPFGPQLGYFVDINVKSATLQDLKVSRRRSWYDLR